MDIPTFIPLRLTLRLDNDQVITADGSLDLLHRVLELTEVPSGAIPDASITADELAADSVGTTELAANAVTEAKLTPSLKAAAAAAKVASLMEFF